MYEMSDDQRRLGGQRLGSGAMPVLFHLQDISRPRPTAAPPLPKAALPELPAEAAASANMPVEATVPGPLLAIETPKDNVPDLILPPTLPSLSLGPPLMSLQPPAGIAANPSTDALGLNASGDFNSSAPPVSKPDTVESHDIARPPSAVPAVALASQSTARRKPKTAASEDWFASHGKFIAIAFVLALIGTIYFARTNRRQAEGTVAAPSARSTVASSASIDAPAKESSLAVDTKVELHPPEAPQLASTALASDKPKANDNLFVFPSAKPADERVATRAEGDNSSATQQSASSKQATATSPALVQNALSSQPVGAPATSPTSSSAAPIAQSYPMTSAPPLVSPTPSGRAVLPPPVTPTGAAQPFTSPPPNYRSQFPAPVEASAPPPQGWSPPGPGYDSPGSSQPWNNTVRGPRYERTGSGNQ